MLALHTCGYTQKRSGERFDTLRVQRRRGPEGVKGEGKPRIEKGNWTEINKNKWTEGRTDECEEAMLRGLYLRLGLLGWRRCCDCCGASPAAMAVPLPLPAPLSWWCCRAALLLEREEPCERECWLCPWLWLWLWPSDGEGFDVPGLLWDFSIVGTCVSKTTRFTKLPKKNYLELRGCYFLYTTWGKWLTG